MITVSQKQASQRWDTITPQLREALFSDVNADFIWNLCQSEHLTEEMSYEVAEISGYVLLGLLQFYLAYFLYWKNFAMTHSFYKAMYC